MDSIVREEPLALYWPEMVRWWLASVLFGPVLGGVGAYVGRAGVFGLVAGLVIPAAATLRLLLSPPGSAIATPATGRARGSSP